MTEYSWFWDNLSPGDANQAAYSSAEFSSFIRHFLNSDRTVQGPIAGVDNELAVTGTATPVSVATGAAMVLGRLYQNTTSAVTVAVPSPAVSSRIDVICLQSDTAAQTVRAGRHAGVEGGGTPALTQTDALWEIPLANATITTAGVITLTDVRQFVRSPLAAGYEADTLVAGDGAHTAGAWNDIGAPLQVSLTAGTWWITGTITVEAGASADNRGVRLYNNNSAASLATTFFYIPATWKSSAVVQTVVTLTALNVIKLQFYAVDATDIVHAVIASGTTKITALRVA